MNTNKLLVAAVLAASIAAPIAGFVGEMKGQSMTSTGVRVPFLHGFPIGPSASQAELASLAHADEWLNSPPLTPAALRGKVVLVNFWTYTCINWRRQLPYVRAWAEKYKDQGLVVIGVHAPEFEFEKNIANVRWAVKDMKIDYPVAVDNNHVIWRAFRNQAWPALYFIDAQGRRPPSFLWRRFIRTVGNGHPGAAARGRSHRRQPRAGEGGCAAVFDAAADWAQSQISGKLRRV